jgi:glutamate/tyrosine decarboxylase-like PLP-dependent enzyme
MNAEKIMPLLLGPKAENQDLYENVIIEAIRDNCFLRKNFHPDDKSIISEVEKLSAVFQSTSANFKQKMQELLADLKKGVPLYHPRYIGHMHGDLLLPAIAAYFATMLYNSNNVVGESSPATTKMEFEYIRNLCRMVGYAGFKDLDTDEKKVERNEKTESFYQSWGHLCSGGTSANIEALWVARNMKYYPLSVKLAIDNPDNETDDFFNFLKEGIDIWHFNDKFKKIKDISYEQAFNLSVCDILHLKEVIYNTAKVNAARLYDNKSGWKTGKSEFVNDFINKIRKRIEKYSVIELGVYGIHLLIKEKIHLPKLYITKSYHYSWDKAMDIIGIGRGNVVRVEMTDEFSMDIEDLKNQHNNKHKEKPILAVVGILGSSKQGSIDPLDEIVEFRKDLEKEKKSFYFHIDGAYGGYFPALLWGITAVESKENYGTRYDFQSEDNLRNYLRENELKTEDGKLNKKEIKNSTAVGLIEENAENLHRKLSATKDADSYTIDPHKMGYVPYPAGSILYRDTRLKDFVSYEPSYLHKSSENDEYSAFLGQWTLEGSRPGAAAACYMVNQLLPFNQDGYGLLIRNTVQMANTFIALIDKFNEKSNKDNRGYQIFPLYERPETNIVEYVLLNSDKIKNVKYLNILTSKLYDHFSVSGKSVIPSKNFMVAKEDFEVNDIPSGVWASLKKKGIEKSDEEKPIILSSVFMNPLSIYIDNVEDYYNEFFKEMVEYADEMVMPDILFEQICDGNDGSRLKVLWIENEGNVENTKKILLYKSNTGQYLDIDFCELPTKCNAKDAKTKINDAQYKVTILDLNLLNNRHDEVKPECIQTAIDLYESMSDGNKTKVIFCSKFFKTNEIEIKKQLKEKIIFEDTERMVIKPEIDDNIKGLNPLKDSIFKVWFQNK